MNNLGMLYKNQDKYAQAESLYTRVLEVRRRVLGEQHPDTLVTVNSLAMLYTDQRKFAQAEPLFREVVEVGRRVLGADHPRRLDSMNDLALLYLYEGKYVPAEAVLRPALASHEEALTHSWVQYHCQSLLGASLAGQYKYGEAEPLLLSGYQGMMQREATIPAYQRSKLEQARKWIVQLYRDWGKPEQAAQWQHKLQSAASVARVQ
jgi:eukaryotic-like serine/threonine-protein kinase